MIENTARKNLLAVFAAALCVLPLAGCGDNNAPVKEDPAALQKRVDSAKEMRSYFDKSGGNYDTLSATDKEALNKITGSETLSREAFSHMAPNPSGGAAPGGLPPSGG